MMDRFSSSAFTASNIDDFYEHNVEFSVGIAFPQAGHWYFRLLSRGHGVSTSFGTIAIGWEMVAQLRRFQKVGLATSCAVSAIEIAGTHGHLLIFLYLFLIFHAGHAVANSFTVHSFLFVFALLVTGLPAGLAAESSARSSWTSLFGRCFQGISLRRAFERSSSNSNSIFFHA